MVAMSTPHRLAALALAVFSAAAITACGKGSAPAEEAAPRVPASSDPAGKDIVEGAVVAAQEKAGGIRLYKVTHVDDYPDPIGYEYHMIAYDPKCDSFEMAAKTWKNHAATPMFNHLVVREVSFLPRDHRVLFVEPLTPAELATYTSTLNSRGGTPPGAAPAAQP
jgi:hypothetical protein